MSEPKLRKVIGLRNIVTIEDPLPRWDYLLFYDKDDATQEDINKIIHYLDTPNMNMSYIIYRTKGGIHVIGLTPMNAENWGIVFQHLQYLTPEYYSGQTIRVSRKQNETQSLIYYNFNYPLIYNLAMMYKKRFPEIHLEFGDKLLRNYKLVFEKYWSYKL